MTEHDAGNRSDLDAIANRIAVGPATVRQILWAANHYLSIEGDEDMAWAFREAVAIRCIREEPS